MRYSKLFGKSIREVSREIASRGLGFLLRGGFIRESSAGRYYMLPLGMRVQDRICRLVEEEMNQAGAQKILAPVLHPRELWEETKRTESVSFELMQVRDRSERSFILGGTAEEMMVALVRQFSLSERDLPFCIYQFSTKFRDELRARGGLLRVREFLMKDAYSFHANREDFEIYYRTMSDTYSRIFTRLGLTAHCVQADNGYMGGDYCHEFIVDHDTGESDYLVNKEGNRFIHQDIADRTAEAGLQGWTRRRGIEVGNIFQLGTWYSERMKGADYAASNGARKLFYMGCYGIGIGRTLGSIAEIHNDDKGLCWPGTCSPFDFHLISLGHDSSVREAAEKLYGDLTTTGKSVLFDDRDVSAGVKFADGDLIGITNRIVVSRRLIEGGLVEMHERKSARKTEVRPEMLLSGQSAD